MIPARRAFSVIELLVVLTGVVVVTSVVLVSLRGAIGSAQTLRDVQNLSRCIQDFSSWSAEHDGTMLNAGLPGDPAGLWFYGEPHMVPSSYPSHVSNWPLILSHWSGQHSPHWQSTQGPDTLNGQIDLSRYENAPEYHILPTKYLYSLTMVTSPDLWKFPGHGFSDYDEAAPFYELVHSERVRSPSGKGVLVHWARPAQPREWDIAFADGSVRTRHRDELREPGAFWFGDPTIRYAPVLGTLDGYLGSDE